MTPRTHMLARACQQIWLVLPRTALRDLQLLVDADGPQGPPMRCELGVLAGEAHERGAMQMAADRVRSLSMSSGVCIVVLSAVRDAHVCAIGYYPPNHHMVTGSDNLDSYEALWELAELLGQVKPPTATREDIDKSGLQIVKASELPRLEEEGRVASNCVERVRIVSIPRARSR